MSVGLVVCFKTDAKLEEVVKFVREKCGMKLRRKEARYVAMVGSVFLVLSQHRNSIGLWNYSNAAVHDFYHYWSHAHKFATFTLAELICDHFECDAMVSTDVYDPICEIRFDPRARSIKKKRGIPVKDVMKMCIIKEVKDEGQLREWYHDLWQKNTSAGSGDDKENKQLD